MIYPKMSDLRSWFERDWKPTDSLVAVFGTDTAVLSDKSLTDMLEIIYTIARDQREGEIVRVSHKRDNRYLSSRILRKDNQY